MKGTVLDLFVVMALLLSSFIGILVAYYLLDIFQSRGYVTQTEGVNVISKGILATKLWDYAFLLFTVGLGIATIIGAFLIKTHPIFFFISLISLIFVLIVSPQVSNVAYSFSHTDLMSSTADYYPIMLKIMDNLPLILFGFGLLIMLALYAKIQSVGV